MIVCLKATKKKDPWVECDLTCCEGHPWVQLFQTHIQGTVAATPSLLVNEI